MCQTIPIKITTNCQNRPIKVTRNGRLLVGSLEAAAGDALAVDDWVSATAEGVPVPLGRPAACATERRHGVHAPVGSSAAAQRSAGALGSTAGGHQ